MCMLPEVQAELHTFIIRDLTLAVIGIVPVFSKEVFVEQLPGDG